MRQSELEELIKSAPMCVEGEERFKEYFLDTGLLILDGILKNLFIKIEVPPEKREVVWENKDELIELIQKETRSFLENGKI